MSNVTPMSILHELMMQRKSSPPLYELIEDGMSQIGYKYFVKASNIIAVGTGRNKREAKHNGAAIVLKLLSLKGIEHRHNACRNRASGDGQLSAAAVNSIGALTAFCHAHDMQTPTYSVSVAGPPHEAVFTVRCSAYGYICEVSGGQKKRAKQRAAAELLEKLTEILPDTTTCSSKRLHMSSRNAMRRRNKQPTNDDQ